MYRLSAVPSSPPPRVVSSRARDASDGSARLFVALPGPVCPIAPVMLKAPCAGGGSASVPD